MNIIDKIKSLLSKSGPTDESGGLPTDTVRLNQDSDELLTDDPDAVTLPEFSDKVSPEVNKIYFDAKNAMDDGDYARALELFTQAADGGSATALAQVGFLYEYGNGTEKDLVRAFRCYRKGADMGDPNSMFLVGAFYHEGLGVERDDTEALRWFRKAVRYGNSYAQCNLGYMYAMGEGVAKDLRKARRWLEKAYAQGNDNAKIGLDKINALGLPDIEYVDLGLASGTLWANMNQGADDIYDVGTPVKARETYGLLPTYGQFAELIEQCSFSAAFLRSNDDNDFYVAVRVVGPNGKAIFFPASTLDPDADGYCAVSCWCEYNGGPFAKIFLVKLSKSHTATVLGLSNIDLITLGISLATCERYARTVKQK